MCIFQDERVHFLFKTTVIAAAKTKLKKAKNSNRRDFFKGKSPVP